MKTKKISFKHSNFDKSNTPDLANKIGNIGLRIGVIGGAIVAASATLPVALPAVVITAATYAVSIGAITKAITKCFGEHEHSEAQ